MSFIYFIFFQNRGYLWRSAAISHLPQRESSCIKPAQSRRRTEPNRTSVPRLRHDPSATAGSVL